MPGPKHRSDRFRNTQQSFVSGTMGGIDQLGKAERSTKQAVELAFAHCVTLAGTLFETLSIQDCVAAALLRTGWTSDVTILAARLLNHLKTREGAWGEEIATSIDMASAMIDSKQFRISQKCISVKIVMDRFKDGTFH